MKPRLVMFDFDGTLADSFAWFLEVSDAIADRFRFQRFDRSDLEGLRGLDFRTMMKRHRVAFWKLPFIARQARALMARDIDRIPLFAGVDTALAKLADGSAKLAIVTSNSRNNVQRVLGATALALQRLRVRDLCAGQGPQAAPDAEAHGGVPGGGPVRG
jgi:phosphoglycolate phosphatase